MSLLDRLAAEARRPDQVRAVVARVTAVGSTTVNLSVGGGSVVGVPCARSYTNPRVGDVVLVLKVASAWLVLSPLGRWGSGSSPVIPTTHGDLPAGIDGYVLTASDSADLGYVWAPAVPLTTKGDLLAHDGDDPVRLPVGADGQVLKADSTAAEGVAWVDSPGATSFYRNAWTLALGGAQTKTLTYTPLPGSEHVYLNGVEQDEGTDWTRTAASLSVLAAMDARVSARLECRYAYDGDAAPTPAVAMTDSFARSGDLAGSTTATGGGTWLVANGTWQTNGTAADCTGVTSGANGLASAVVDCGSSDGTLVATWSQNNGVEKTTGIYLRASADGATGIFVDRLGKVYLITDATTYDPDAPVPAVFVATGVWWSSGFGSITAVLSGSSITLSNAYMGTSYTFSTTHNLNETHHGFAFDADGAAATNYVGDWSYTP